MAWLGWIALVTVVATVLQQVWAGAGPPWRWPVLIYRAIKRGLRSRWHKIVSRWNRKHGKAEPDPFEILQMQRRLGAIAEELQRLESEDADRQYWARAHRIHSRKAAYDQLLVEACKLAGVPGARTAPGTIPTPTGRRSDEERFRDEMELASRGWSW
jgi:hypothetical protein